MIGRASNHDPEPQDQVGRILWKIAQEVSRRTGDEVVMVADPDSKYTIIYNTQVRPYQIDVNDTFFEINTDGDFSVFIDDIVDEISTRKAIGDHVTLGQRHHKGGVGRIIDRHGYLRLNNHQYKVKYYRGPVWVRQVGNKIIVRGGIGEYFVAIEKPKPKNSTRARPPAKKRGKTVP